MLRIAEGYNAMAARAAVLAAREIKNSNAD